MERGGKGGMDRACPVHEQRWDFPSTPAGNPLLMRTFVRTPCPPCPLRDINLLTKNSHGQKNVWNARLVCGPVLWAAPTAPTPHPSLQSNQDPFPDRHPPGLLSSHCFRSPGLFELRFEWCIKVPSCPQHPGFSGQSLRTSWPGSLGLPEPDHLEGLPEVCQEDTSNGFHALSLWEPRHQKGACELWVSRGEDWEMRHCPQK